MFGFQLAIKCIVGNVEQQADAVNNPEDEEKGQSESGTGSAESSGGETEQQPHVEAQPEPKTDPQPELDESVQAASSFWRQGCQY